MRAMANAKPGNFVWYDHLTPDPKAAAGQLADVLENFDGRHRNLLETFERRADEMEDALLAHCTFSEVQRQLIGAYFMHEYSFEASAK